MTDTNQNNHNNSQLDSCCRSKCCSCCLRPRSVVIDKLFLFLFIFFIVEFICLPKYIILPVILISVLGGPVTLILPWSLWAVVIFSAQLFLVIRLDFTCSKNYDSFDRVPSAYEVLMTLCYSRNFTPDNNNYLNQPAATGPKTLVAQDTHVESLASYPFDRTEELARDSYFQSTSPSLLEQSAVTGPLQLRSQQSSKFDSNENSPVVNVLADSGHQHQLNSNSEERFILPKPTSLVRLTISNVAVACWIIVSIVDIIMSVASVVISLIFIIITFVEADGVVVYGYESEFASLICECVFSCLSILARAGIISVISLLRYKLPCKYELTAWTRWQSSLENIHQDVFSNTDDAKVVLGTNDNQDSVKTENQWYYAVQRDSNIFRFAFFIGVVSLAFALLGLVYTSIVINYVLTYSTYKSQDTVSQSGCDNMVSEYCALPYPSYSFLLNESTNDEAYTDGRTGLYISLPKQAFPYTKNSQFIDLSFTSRFDGFSVSAPLIWYLPNVLESQLIDFKHIQRSMLLNSTSLVVNIDTAELHPHFTEIDYFSKPGYNKIFYTQPATSLKYATHYAVVIQKLKQTTVTSSELIQPASLLQQYVSSYVTNIDYASNNPIDVARYFRFKQKVFPKLQSLGINLNQSQLIWDFRTASLPSLLQSALLVHNSTITKVGKMLNLTRAELFEGSTEFVSSLQPTTANSAGSSTQPSRESISFEEVNKLYSGGSAYRRLRYTSNSCTDSDYSDSDEMAMTVYYRMKVPWYLQNLQRQHNSLRPELIGLQGESSSRIPFTGDVGMLLEVPCSVVVGRTNATALVEFGHGIFDSRNAIKYSWLRQHANAKGWILWGMDWRGFAGPDIPLLGRLVLHDAGAASVNEIEGSIVQGFCSKLAGRFITRHILQQDKQFLKIPDTTDLSQRSLPSHFIGESMGSILGGGYTPFAGYSRSVFFVAGSPFTFLITRSDLFGIFSALLDFQFYSTVDMRIVISTWQLLFDTAETTGWSRSGVYNTTSSLTEISLGDSTVSTVSGRIFAYNLHSYQLPNPLFPIYGIPTIEGNASTVVDTNFSPIRNILVEGSFTSDAASIPTTNEIPSNPTKVHYCLDSIVPSIREQVREFITTGLVSNTCSNNGQCIYGKTASC